MQILINNSQFFHQKYGGVSRYSSCLLENLIKEKLDINLIAPIYKNRYLKDIKNIKKRGFYLSKYPNLKILRVLNNRLTELYKKNIKADVIHDLYYPESEKDYLKKKVITIHDTIHEKFNHLYKDNYYEFRKKIIEKTDKFICVSENTRQDFIEYYKINEDRTCVITHGYEHFSDIETIDISKFEKLKKPFLLYVGGRSKYKNFKLLAKAFAKTNKINENFNIVCYGGEKLSNEEFSYFKKLGIEKKIIKLNGSDSLLKSLYINCELLISTSEYEGFGITILEAIYLNCKVLSNEINVFRNIYKDSINYFRFNNLDHLIYQLENIIIKRKNNINQIDINQILLNNNWESSGNKTYEIYKSLANV